MKKKFILGLSTLAFLLVFSVASQEVSAQRSGIQKPNFKMNKCILKRNVGVLCIFPGADCRFQTCKNPNQC